MDGKGQRKGKEAIKVELSAIRLVFDAIFGHKHHISVAHCKIQRLSLRLQWNVPIHHWCDLCQRLPYR